MTSALSGQILPASRPLPATAATPAATTGSDELEQLLREWLLGYGSANTRAAYDGDLQHWLTFLAASGVDPLTEARRLHTHAWLRAQEAEGASTATRARRLAAVSSFYGWLIAEEHTDRANPAAIDSKRKPKATARSKTAGLTKTQADDLIAVADADTGPQAARTSAIVATLLFTGIRVSEAVDADVDQLGHDRGHRVLRFTGKGDQDHLVVIPPPATHRIDAYLTGRDDLTSDRLPVAAGAAGARVPRPLFITGSGGRLDRGAVWRLLRRLAKTAGIPVTMSPHVLRHTYATLARDAGARLEDIQDGLGHADPRTTRRYQHASARLDRSPGYTLANYLAG
jgi:integrase/recombinase XerD